MKAKLIRITVFPAHTGLANHQSTSLLLDLTAKVKNIYGSGSVLCCLMFET